MRGLLMVVLTSGLSFTSCLDFLPGRACTAIYAYGVSAHVTDGNTGQVITNATLTLRDGDYTEVMELLPTGDYAGAGEREGTYTLTIDVPGVRSETVTGIVVGFDGCHVIGVGIEVEVESGRMSVSVPGLNCTTEVVYGVTANVTNAVNGQAITNATPTLTDGDFSEVMGGGTSGQYTGAAERTGIYTLVVEAPGYQTTTVEDIVVNRNPCHVNQAIVNVELQPTP